MSNIINFEDFRKKKAETEDETIKEVYAYDFRNYFDIHVKTLSPKERKELLQTRVAVIHLAFGAVIAERVTYFSEDAKRLLALFKKHIKRQDITLKQIPKDLLGYVYNDRPGMMAYARRSILASPLPF